MEASNGVICRGSHGESRLSSKQLFLTSQGRKGLGREKYLHVALREQGLSVECGVGSASYDRGSSKGQRCRAGCAGILLSEAPDSPEGVWTRG